MSRCGCYNYGSGREGKEATLGGGGVAINDGNTWPCVEWVAAMVTTMEEGKER